MSGRQDTAKLNWPRWQQALLIAVLAVLAAVRLSALVDYAAYRAGLLGPITTIGGTFASDPDAPRYFRRVATVEPGGPLDKAGVRIGDSIHTDPIPVALIRHAKGERIAVVIDHGGVRTRGQFTVEPARQSETARQGNFWLALNTLAAMVTTLIGCFILWRGWGNKTAMLLGAAMYPLHVVSPTIPPAFGGQVASSVFMSLTVAMYMLSYSLPVFAMRLYEESVGKLSHWLRRAVKVFVGYAALHQVIAQGAIVTGTVIPVWLSGIAVNFLNTQIGMVLCVTLLFAAWHHSDGAARNRNAVILFAFLAYVLGAIAGFASLDANMGVVNPAAFGSLVIFNALIAGLLAPGLLAYAMLRHKLFDLGFAVNRTLVFASISAVLLVSFGTLEWAVDHLVPEAWHEESALYSAGIAVGLFLLFHRIRDAVEHGIERLFFRSWQRNEAALKRFVATAAHVEKPAALAGQFVTELGRFTGGAAAALYVRTPEGDYASAAGATIDADDPALAAMRAEQGPVIPAEVHSLLPAALALPMMHQAALAGFVLLGPKPTGEDYRPDEIEILGWATQQVGLDLQAIRVRDLELTNIRLVERNQTLTEILASAAAKT